MKSFYKRLSLRSKMILLNLIFAGPILAIIFLLVFPLYKKMAFQNKRNLTKATVELAINIVDQFAKEAELGHMTVPAAQAAAINTIKQLRYDGTDYFWIQDTNLRMVMHPTKPELIGADLTQLQDPTGKRFYFEIGELVKAQKNGFVDYYWAKKPGEAPVPKSSYVQMTSWNWILGSGLYVDDVLSDCRTFQIEVLGAVALTFFFALAISLIFSAQIARSVSILVSQMRASSDTVSEASSQVASAAQILSENVTENAASLEETSASLEEIVSVAKQTKMNLEKAAKNAADGVELSNEGGAALQALIVSMSDIAESSNKVTEIIAIIDDISFQTNLLALNAAVEAARAGEQGRGFSVVAEAVRSLAGKSASAAKEIGSLIKISSAHVGKGQRSADAGNAAIERIVKSNREIASLIESIKQAGGEQAIGLDQIAAALTLVDRSTQASAASAEESSAVAQQMRDESSKMNSFVADLSMEITGRPTDFANASRGPGVPGGEPVIATLKPRARGRGSRAA